MAYTASEQVLHPFAIGTQSENCWPYLQQWGLSHLNLTRIQLEETIKIAFVRTNLA